MTASEMNTTDSQLARTAGHGKLVEPRFAARIAGCGYVVIFVLAIFANFIVREGLVSPDDAAATVANIRGSMLLFRLGLIAFLIVFIADVVLAWALHIVFREVSSDLSLVTAWFRLVYTVFLGIGIIFIFQTILLLSGADYISALSPAEIEAEVMIAMESFNYAWLVGLAAFGVHLALLGTLAMKSGFVPKLLGVVLILAGAAYAIDTVAHALLPNYSDLAMVFLLIVAIPSVLGEGWLGLWALFTRRYG
jgi:hypothetical protein